MALTSQDEQAALISWGRPYAGSLPLADPTLNEGDRLQLLYLSRGIVLGGNLVSGNFGLGTRGFVPAIWPESF